MQKWKDIKDKGGTFKPTSDAFYEAARSYLKTYTRDEHYPADYLSQEIGLAHLLRQTQEEGAAVAFGLMGMAEAIRQHHPCLCGEHEWTWTPRLNDDVCIRCRCTFEKFADTCAQRER